jgi:hypothetical protein
MRWKRSNISSGVTAAVKAMVSRSGTPESLSKSGSIPETPQSPPANTAVDKGAPSHTHPAVPHPAPNNALAAM